MSSGPPSGSGGPKPPQQPAPQQPASQQPPPQPQTIVVQQPGGRWRTRLLWIALIVSVLVNIGMYAAYRDYFSGTEYPKEKYHSGSKTAQQKIALIEVDSTIMPPFTERIIRSIEKAGKDDAVKGVVLVVDSPGGLVADSHEIYHALGKLRREKGKPIVVAMKRMAASGGYYIAMGAGPEGTIYAEPTTWTGSIGVIIPHYDISGLAEQWKIEAEPLKSGKYKDALSPFRELTEEERAIWNAIVSDAYERFITVIDEGRKDLDSEQIRELATGQVYTAEQALENELIDEIGYEDDAIDDLKERLGLETVRVVRYQHQKSLLEALGQTAEANRPEKRWESLLDATVPRAMYYCSWLPSAIPGM